MPQAQLVVIFLKLVAIIMAQSKLTTFFKSAASNVKCFIRSYDTRYVTYMYHKLDGRAESDVEADNYNCSSDEKRVEVNTKKVTVLPVLSVSVFLVP